MTTYQDTRALLAASRADSQLLAAQQAERREQLKEKHRRLASIRRSRNENDPAWVALRDALEAQAAALELEIDANRVQLSQLRATASSLQTALAAYWDPEAQIQQLDDGYPILLFPLRLETRFKDVLVNGVTTKQLWVRVYPDECQIDAFEELLSVAEVASGRSFWAEMWKAGGIEAQERGAWRALVASHGSGRAEWILKRYAPTNLVAKPTKSIPEDVVLVVFPQAPLSSAQETAACTYWEAVWKADGDLALQADALDALADAVQDPGVVETILRTFIPENLGDDPPGKLDRSSVDVTCAKVLLEPPAAARETAWTHAPRAWALPDRFVLMAYNGDVEVKRVSGKVVSDHLATGPDRSLPSAEQLRAQDDELVVNEDLRWTVDFERAVEVGMGFKVDLDPTKGEDVNGFERLVVLGVRFSADHAEGQTLLETLLSHHHHSKRGLSLVPQGSPTNNTEGAAAPYSWTDDADASFDVVLKRTQAFVETVDPFARSDGEWLARSLGITTDTLKSVPHAGGRDQAEARAMNTALWTATLGYFMEEMMTPVFSDEVIEATRRFFLRHVSGRGPVPAVRVGRQPYGILPAMAFSQYHPSGNGPAPLTQAHLVNLHTVLSKMDGQWETMAKHVAHVGAPGNAHKTLLDIIGLNAGSVEYHQRYAESLEMVLERLKWQFGSGGVTALFHEGDLHKGFLSSSLGYSDPARPPIVDRFFFNGSTLLSGPMIDDVPLSEDSPIRAYTAGGHNYIQWLRESPFEAIRLNDIDEHGAPAALLYLMLRHALMLGYWEAAVRLLDQHNLIDPVIARTEPSFLHMQPIPSSVESLQNKLVQLYRVEPSITGDSLPLIDFIERMYMEGSWGADLLGMIRALQALAATPTARLERLLAEHVDCASYRLDAWKTGLAAMRREQMSGPRPTGVYLGAYGWLEGVKPKAQQLTPATLTPEMSSIFQKTGQVLVEDSGNGGYIHAPSINHAATAAILKNAYMVNASDASPEARQRMAVNLSSERVRQALALLEGIRHGQSLAALLGYRFERGLHDRHALVEVDQYIYSLRQKFPLVADKLNSTKTDGEQDIDLIEARNVLDGLRLVEHVRASGKLYLIPSSPAETAINAEVDVLLDLHDAVSDLLMAESVYQVVQGNFERSAAITTAFSKGKYPPEPEVVRTPRSGTALTHRVVVHLDPDAAAASNLTPRAVAEAPLNAWLSSRLPDPTRIACQATYTSMALLETTLIVTMDDLGVAPIDLIYVNLDLEQAMTELDDRVVQFVRYHGAHPAHPIHIQYAEAIDARVTLFELAPLIASLRSLVLKSRGLGPTDLGLPTETVAAGVSYEFDELAARIGTAAVRLDASRTTLLALASSPADLDDYVQAVTNTLLDVALHGVPSTGTSDTHGSIRAIYQAVLGKVGSFVARWDEKAAEYAARMATYSPLATDEQQFDLLLAAEGSIASTTTTDLPAQPLDFKTAVEATKAQFDAVLDSLKALLAPGHAKLVDYLAAVQAQAQLAAAHDATPLDLEHQNAATISLRAELVARVQSLVDDLTSRITGAAIGLAEAAAIDHAEGRVRRMLEAACQVLGDEIKLLPRFILSEVRGVEVENRLAHAPDLLDYLTTTSGRRFPVDDWLYGVARVREKLHHWETVVSLAEAFTGGAVELTALQLPYRPDDHWLGLEIPHGYAPTGDRLLYTAHFAGPFQRAAPQCGLLLDEWTEVIPAKDQVTGVTFNFDRPRAAPPQAMLLVVPPVLTGTWHWEHVVGALQETLAAAKQRAVEPDQIDNTGYAQFLPATMMATTLYQVTIATNIAFNNGIYKQFGG